MAACFWSPISFPPVLMIRDGESFLFHWGTTHCIATFGTQTAIRIKCLLLFIFFYQTGQLFVFCLPFYLLVKCVPCLGNLLKNVVRSRMPLVHLDLEALSEMTENAQSTATNQAPSSCRAESCFVLIELEGWSVIRLWQGKYLFIFPDIAFYLQIHSLERSIIRPFVCFFVLPI